MNNKEKIQEEIGREDMVRVLEKLEPDTNPGASHKYPEPAQK